MEQINLLITSTVRAKLLYYFLVNAKEGTVRRIAKELQANPAQASKELISLEKLGLIMHKDVGNQKLFSLNPRCTFSGELRSILIKTSGYDQRIKQALADIPKIEKLFIFGSYAGGDFGSRSDIDLFIIGAPDLTLLTNRIHAIEKEINHDINYIVMPKEEFSRKKEYGFVKNVLASKKIILKGGVNES